MPLEVHVETVHVVMGTQLLDDRQLTVPHFLMRVVPRISVRFFSTEIVPIGKILADVNMRTRQLPMAAQRWPEMPQSL